MDNESYSVTVTGNGAEGTVYGPPEPLSLKSWACVLAACLRLASEQLSRPTAWLAERAVGIAESNEQRTSPSCRIILDCDDLDYQAIRRVIAMRERNMPMPDGDSNSDAAAIAEICRGYEEWLNRTGPEIPDT